MSQTKVTQLPPQTCAAHNMSELSNKERSEQRLGRFRPISDQPGSSRDSYVPNVHSEISPKVGPKRNLEWHNESSFPDTKRARETFASASSNVELPQVMNDAGHGWVAKRKLALTNSDRSEEPKNPRVNLPPGSKLAERFPQFVRGIAEATPPHEDPTRSRAE